ncbi:hypothetical protein ACVOPT_005075, partial [Enterobacter hormaechei]
GAEYGEEKAVCIGLPHKVHTVPDVSVRLRVALYFVNIFLQGNKSFCSEMSYNKPLTSEWQTVAISDNRWQSLIILWQIHDYFYLCISFF